MSRMKIEKNIAWDDVKKKYYVTLYFGKDDTGAIINNCSVPENHSPSYGKVPSTPERHPGLPASTVRLSPDRIFVQAYHK